MTAFGLLAGLVTLAAGYQVWRITATGFIQREVRQHPRRKIALFGVAAGAALVVLAAAATSPTARRLGVAGLAIALAAAWWRAHPSYGRRRRWPPGSLGIGHSIDAVQNENFYLEQAARYGPIFKTSYFGHPVVCFVGIQRIRTVLAEHAQSLEGADFLKPLARWIPGGVLRHMRPDDHKIHAPVFRRVLGSLALEEAAPDLRRHYRSTLDRMTADSARTPDGVTTNAYLWRLILEIVGTLFYGLAPDDPRIDELGRAMPSLLAAANGTRGWRQETPAGLARVTALMRDLQSGCTDTSLHRSSVLRALVEANPTAIDDPTWAGNFILITRIAYGDLAGLHTWIFKQLIDHPEVVTRIREHPEEPHPESTSSPDLPTRVVMETLRLQQSEYLYREVGRTFEVDGMVIPAGWTARFCVHESHRDPALFPDPDRFDPDRFARRTYSGGEYAPFGADMHACMGTHLAHFLGRIFVEELAGGYDCRAVHDGPPEGGPRHRHHWRPSSQLRIAMSPRA